MRNHHTMYSIILFLVINIVLLVSTENEKTGSCPPPLSVDICYTTCEEDLHCRGLHKCCPTECGGTFCVEPIAMRTVQQFKGKKKKLNSLQQEKFRVLY